MEKATTLQVVQYLIEEIADEEFYNAEYEKQKNLAKKKCHGTEDPAIDYYLYMPEAYRREPRKSVIEDNSKMIRRLMLKMRDGLS